MKSLLWGEGYITPGTSRSWCAGPRTHPNKKRLGLELLGEEEVFAVTNFCVRVHPRNYVSESYQT